MMLLRYWKAHGEPRMMRTVPGLPTNDVFIEARGREAIRIGSDVVRLDRYVIDGVVWGRETVWLDERDALAAAITRAGGLSFEAVREDLESALVGFVQRATRDRMADLEAITHRLPLLKSGSYAMTGATIVDGTGRAAIPDGVVVVRDGRIADVGPRAGVTIPPGVPSVAVDGKTIVPGLWDMHTHVTQIEWAPVLSQRRRHDWSRHGGRVRIRRPAARRPSLRDALSVRVCSPPFDRRRWAQRLRRHYATTPEEAKRAVAKYHDAGQQIKIYSLVTPPIVEAICAKRTAWA
jgi:hypothetical protein